MDRSDVEWRGYFTALVTPFTEDAELDEQALREVTRNAVDSSVHGILVNGSTGEWFSQTTQERMRVAEVVIEECGGRVPTVVGVTCSRIPEAIELARHAAAIGADSVMASPPPLARATEAELISYYTQIFSAVEVPAWLYNFPQDNGRNITVREIEMLADIPTVVAIKQSTASADELIRTIDAVGSRLRVFGNLLNRMGLALISSGYGGDGHFGSGLLLGRDMPEFFEAAWRGDAATAEQIADRFARLMSGMVGDRGDGYNWGFGGMQGTLKTAMRLLGEPGGYPRPPKLPIEDPSVIRQIRDVLEDVGLSCTEC